LVLGFSNFFWYIHPFSSMRRKSLIRLGSPSRRHSAADPSSSSRRSFASSATSGARPQSRTGAIWGRVC
jgi:hypothetical protein